MERLEREQSEPLLTGLDKRTIHTIGHSTRTIEDFIGLLQAHQISMLVDVRRWPMSKRHLYFNRDALSNSLAKQGIGYLWRQDLGGFRKASTDSPNTAWRVATFRAYADFMLTDDFVRIIGELECVARSQRTALMCAEAVPWHCHRQLLADAFLVREWSERDIMDDGCHAHRLPTFARIEGMSIIYSGFL